MNDGETLQQTQRLLTRPDVVANVEASTILYDSLFSNGSNEPFGYEGMPLTAAAGGTINFDSSVVVPLNWDDFFAGNDTYIELTGGNLIADEFRFFMATASPCCSMFLEARERMAWDFATPVLFRQLPCLSQAVG